MQILDVYKRVYKKKKIKMEISYYAIASVQWVVIVMDNG